MRWENAVSNTATTTTALQIDDVKSNDTTYITTGAALGATALAMGAGWLYMKKNQGKKNIEESLI